jgi:anti-sigma regulatory factor (Ser/Thr protein kinase)
VTTAPVSGTATAGVLAPLGPAAGVHEHLHSDSFSLPAHGSSVALARHRVGKILADWDVPAALCDDVALILSELFTNALIHTDSAQIVCRCLATPRVVYLSVTDQGSGPTGPRIRRPDPAESDDEHGRGLLLVSAVAHTWGVATDPGQGRTVWAVLKQERNSYPAI